MCWLLVSGLGVALAAVLQSVEWHWHITVSWEAELSMLLSLLSLVLWLCWLKWVDHWCCGNVVEWGWLMNGEVQLVQMSLSLSWCIDCAQESYG